MPIIKIDDKDYELDSLSDEAKAQLSAIAPMEPLDDRRIGSSA